MRYEDINIGQTLKIAKHASYHGFDMGEEVTVIQKRFGGQHIQLVQVSDVNLFSQVVFPEELEEIK